VAARESVRVQLEGQQRAVLLLRDRVAQREAEVEERDVAVADGEEALRARMEAVDLEVAAAVESERSRLQQLLLDAERVIMSLSVGLPEREAALDAREKQLAAQEASLASRERQLRVDHERQMAVLEAREAQLAQLMASLSGGLGGGSSRDRSRAHTVGTLPDDGMPHSLLDLRKESGSSAGMPATGNAAPPHQPGSGWQSAFSTRPSSAVESSSGGPPSPRSRARDGSAMSMAEMATAAPTPPTGHGGRRPSSLQHPKRGGAGVEATQPPPPPPALPSGRGDRRDLRIGTTDAPGDGTGSAFPSPPSTSRSVGGRGTSAHGRAPQGAASSDGDPSALPAFTRSPPTLRHAQSARSLTTSERKRVAADGGAAGSPPPSPPPPRRRDGAPASSSHGVDGGTALPSRAGMSMPHVVNAMVGRATGAPGMDSRSPPGDAAGFHSGGGLPASDRSRHYTSASAPASPGSAPYPAGGAFPATYRPGESLSRFDHGSAPPTTQSPPVMGLRTMSAMPTLYGGGGGPASGGETDWHAYYAARLGMGMGMAAGSASGRW